MRPPQTGAEPQAHDAPWNMQLQACMKMRNESGWCQKKERKKKRLYPFKFICERLCGLDEFSFFVLVTIFNLKQLCFQLPLKHSTQNLKWHSLLANTGPINIGWPQTLIVPGAPLKTGPGAWAPACERLSPPSAHLGRRSRWGSRWSGGGCVGNATQPSA